MRVVAFPRDIIDADRVAVHQTKIILDKTGQEMAPKNFGGRQPAEVKVRPRAMLPYRSLRALEEVGNPADAAFRQRNLEIGKVLPERRKEIGRASCRERVCQYV